ncbi:MAG: ABC transporter substrate-binding protein [Syntrophales bacterium]|nr:ABC transporter substrate-binding protein [Syntrophales bacterium]MDY0045115.1 ABC transporter substrate-binding protein [Syntrophales bacterium]
MKKKVFVRVLRLCSFFCLTGLCCFTGPMGNAYAEQPVKIGFISALSTPYGASNKATLDITIEEINKAGGILGRPVELITEDWKREVPLAVAAYKKLVLNDKCLLVFTEGTEGSTACAQVGSRLYSTQPHLMFALWTSHDGFTDLVADDYEKYKFIFRVYSNIADTYNPHLKYMEFFKNTIGTKKVALLIEEAGFSEIPRKGKPGVYPTMKEYFEQNGMQVVYYTVTDGKEKMFLPILEKAAASGADTICFSMGYTDTVTLIKQWSQSAAKDMDIVLASGAASSYASFWQMTGGRCLGVTEVAPEITIPFTKQTKPFLEKLKKAGFGFTGGIPGAYDSPWIVKEAIEKAGSTENMEKVIKNIEEGEFQHGFWVWAFDGRHEPKKGYPYFPLLIGQFQEDGRYILVHPENLAKITNPGDQYVRVKDLRKKAGL